VKRRDDPREEYQKRLDARREALVAHDRAYMRIAWSRLATGILMGVVAWLVFWRGALGGWWLVVPPVAFIFLMRAHARLDQTRRRTRRAIEFYERGLQRIADLWAGTGESGERFGDDSHLYARDLDIFGDGSLFQLLTTSRTRAGEETLASWLCEPADREEVLARQDAVEELRALPDLREDLATVGPDLRSSIHPEKLVAWAEAPEELGSPMLRPAAHLAGLAMLGVLVHAFLTDWQWAYYGCLLALWVGALLVRGRVGRVLGGADLPQKELNLMSEVMARLEAGEFTSARLRHLHSRFFDEARPASSEIRRLVRIVDRQRSLKSADLPLTILILLLTVIFVPFALVLLLDLRTAFAIENWRRAHGASVRGWLRAIGEFESLVSLGGYAYERPADPFPEIVEGETLFEGDALCHPLLPTAVCVPNSLRLDARCQLIVLSGSNMSGKSTLLRTVGVNAVLAMAGAPVRGRSLRLSPLAIGATLRIEDSLRTGASRFYAEITRIRDIMEQTSRGLPVLFLLDELLGGTNSHDRAIGAAGILKGLIDRGAIGLATTHDLALTETAETLGARAMNAHFEDRMESGRMIFDYEMKPGVIGKSNALALMRAVGLEV
jgi:MutS domain V/MutS domain III